MSMKFAYQRQGAPLLRWGMAAPASARSATNRSLGGLGSLGGGSSLDHPTLPLPGAPEPIGVAQAVGDCGCGCGGRCSGGMSGIVDAIPGGYLTIGGAVLALLLLRKKRR